MHMNIIKILVLIKTGNHILINVVIDKILKNVVSFIIKYSVLDNIEIIIPVKNITNVICIILKIIFI